MTRIVSFILILAALCSTVHAQAFCALRDPNRQLYRLFPRATSYRSIVRTIGTDAREVVGERLPFGLHFNELGRHTLYVPMRGDEILGLVHVRSEAGRWGLIEVAWALDLDLNVMDFRFQRCRDRQRAALEDPAIKAKLAGAGFEVLRGMLDKSGERLEAEALPVDAAAGGLAVTVLRNGLKTIAATEAAWSKDLAELRAMVMAQDLIPGTQTLREVAPLHGEACRRELAEVVGEAGTEIQRAGSYAWQILDKKGQPLGSVMATSLSHEDVVTELLFLVDRQGRIVRLKATNRWPSKEVESLFKLQVGKSLSDYEECAGRVELSALEVLTTLRSQGLFAGGT